jgi:hypothetical protein
LQLKLGYKVGVFKLDSEALLDVSTLVSQLWPQLN